jgi:hypothetical protein
MKNALRRRPSASLVISILALVIAASGTAVAASKLARGDSLIAKHSLSGNRLRNHTITGKQVNLNKLGKVPTAKNADHATSAVAAITAATATNASNANALGGLPASAFLSAANRIGTNGLLDVTGTLSGNTVTLFTFGPFTVTLTCTRSGTGNTTATVNAISNQADSYLNGNLVGPANTPTDIGPDVGPSTGARINDNNVVDLESSGGSAVELLAADGINSLGTDCWANWSGIA